MSDELISMVRHFSQAVQNDRTINTIFTALCDEVTELGFETYTDEPGADGIAGEAVDLMLCCLDLIFKAQPEWTDEDIIAYARKKCQKWKEKYSNG